MKCTKNDYHCQSAEAVLSELRTSADGLTTAEAAARLGEYGPNELPRETPPSRLFVVLKQFGGGLNFVLYAAAGVSLLTGRVFDAAAIMAEVVINAAFGFAQERKAKQALERLRDLAAPVVTVRRDGAAMRLPAAQLVPGDVVVIAEGDRVGADLRLLSAKDLRTDESALTGESAPVEKTVAPVSAEAALGDRSDMLHLGTMAVGGEGFGVVTATGAATAFGAIAGSLKAVRHSRTPLERRVGRLSFKLAIAALVLSAGVVVLGLWRGLPLLEMFLFGVAAAVSTVPEGLPAVLAIVLAIGVNRMARRNAITRHLPAVETLGGVDVICTDKTGTLTENKMTARAIATMDHRLEVTGGGWEPKGEFLADGQKLNLAEHHAVSKLLRVAALSTRADVHLQDGRWEAVGDPTEAALAVLGQKAGYSRTELLRSERTLDELPFSSERRLRAVLHSYAASGDRPRREIMVVGAFEAVAGRSSQAQGDEGACSLTPEVQARFEAANREMAGRSLRVLAVAFKEVEADKTAITMDDLQGLSLLGLVGMIDPPRPGVTEALKRCREAGIRVIMTTGDHRETALAVAREIGLIDGVGPHGVMNDAEASALSDAELRARLDEIAVFARVSPQTKLRVVTLLQELGHVVAMTGDGVNDAPALKRADIGVAMGRSGTDVAREAAEMILADDDFVSIVNAVEEGRIVFRNVKQTAAYLIMTNMGEVVTLAAAMLLGWPLPLLPVQLLWLNIVTDGFTDVTLATERRHGDELTTPPRAKDAPLLTRNLLVLTVIASALMALGTLAAFAVMGRDGAAHARSVAFVALSLFQLWNVFNMRSPTRSIFELGWTTNRWVFAGVLASLGLAALIMYLPAAQPFFRMVPLGLAEWGILLAGTSSIVWAIEVYKRLLRRGIVPASWL